MSDIIRLLPESLANQIAAGEVVQRPASAVKELLENSVDAGASSIQLIVKEAGKQLIRVIDNGAGMSETDARMSFERHATSKLRTPEDLFRIQTKGFRGEALASIAAVAQVELKTKRKESELGSFICIEGSEIKKQEPCVTPQGSTVSVKNLFFNVPARRNFLKSNPVEMRHIIDEFQRVALAHPGIAFSLHQNDLPVYQLEEGKLSGRIIGLFNKNYREQLVPVDESTDQIKIHGYIGKPEFSKKTRGEQFFFINNRYIKNNYLNHALTSAFEGLLSADTHPFYVLFIDMDPSKIDINVHPTKTEVKFEDERMIYGVVKSAIRQALGAHNIAPSLDFNYDVNFEAITRSKLNFDEISQAKRPMPASSSSFSSPLSKNNAKNWERLYEDANLEAQYSFEDVKKEGAAGAEPIVKTFASDATPEEPTQEIQAATLEAEINPPFQLHKKYICKQVKSGLLIINQEHAHERILFERFTHHLEKGQAASQQFLFPQQLNLNPSDYQLVMEMEEEMKALGFVFSIFGQNTLVINGMPAELSGSNEKEVLEGLIEQFKVYKSELSINRKENLARSMAKRTGLKNGKMLSNEEMVSLIDQLFACTQPNYTPGGQATMYILGLDRLASFFNE
ncbi:DNA mismatch repair endonuclease MutL [Imperialibacter roseus]|uniref:DNA mismatch repair protein MutL n=1 Tax=Imperialibacter roseus TaxID=1324217 RepID=A0ABZ0IM47_9BACT|nr:DNA mismatch repair endonuclease MutL [Imperialibacter roseus]WOK05776.1 DNA mismatch repair endonuclease MutL [Imperialibacter roseus]